jgi:hypothetical protein
LTASKTIYLFIGGKVELLADAKATDYFPITLDILLLQVVQKPATLADHLEQPATGMVVFLMGLEMLLQLLDALAQKSDLDLRGTGVLLMEPVVTDDPTFDVFPQTHFVHLLTLFIL